MSQFFSSGGQIIGVSASASILLMNIQGWFPLGWTSLISLLSKRLQNLRQHHSSKASILWHSAFFMVQLPHPYVTTGKTIALTRWTFIGKVMSLLFSIISIVTDILLNQSCLLDTPIYFLNIPSCNLILLLGTLFSSLVFFSNGMKLVNPFPLCFAW